MSTGNFDADVAVVGGGLAGLRAATALKAGGASVIVLEARDRLGGRTHTRLLGGAAFDFGGQFIGPGQPRIYRLVEELGLQTFRTHTAGRKVVELNGKIRTYSGTIPPLNPLALLRLYGALTRSERWAKNIPPANPWTAESAATLDGMTLEDWQRPRRTSGSAVHRLTDAVVRSIFGADPDELSALHYLGFIASNGGLTPLIETKKGYQQDRIVGGTQQISERMAANLGPGAVVLNAAARAVRQDADGVTVESAAGSWRARRAVVAVPLAIAGRIEYSPALPVARDQIHRRVAMGSTVKILATYQRPFWRERGLSGEAVATSGDLSVVFDNTTCDGAVPCLLAFVVGRPARAFSSAPKAERKARILEELARLHGTEAREPVAYEEMDWGEERYSGGCPVGNFAPGTLATFGAALRAPVGRVHWAGAESARQCTGYMEGALESGERAAEEVLTLLS